MNYISVQGNELVRLHHVPHLVQEHVRSPCVYARERENETEKQIKREIRAALELTQWDETLRLRHVPRLVHEYVSEVSTVHVCVCVCEKIDKLIMEERDR